MKKILFICCTAVTTLLCGCSTKESKLFDEWEPWVVSKSVGQYDLYRYFQNHYCDKGHNNLINYICTNPQNGLADKIYEDISRMVRNKYFELLSEFEYEQDGKIITNLINDFIKFRIDKSNQGVLYWSDSKNNYDVDWIFKSKSTIKVFAADLMERCGKFSDYREFVCKSTSVYSSKLIEKEKQHKVYEVIYRIQFGDVDKYVLCTLLLQNDGSSEIEIVNKSNNLLDLI